MEETTIHLTFRVVPEKLSTGRTVYVAHCKELGVASQGDTEQQARDNVLIAVQLWLETASPAEIEGKVKALNRRRSVTYTADVKVPAYG